MKTREEIMARVNRYEKEYHKGMHFTTVEGSKIAQLLWVIGLSYDEWRTKRPYKDKRIKGDEGG